MLEKEKISVNSTRATPERNSSTVPGLTGPVSLPDDVLEKLYRSYSLKQKRSGLTCFIIASIVFDLWAILVPQGQSAESLGEFTTRTCAIFHPRGYQCRCLCKLFYFRQTTEQKKAQARLSAQ